MTRLHTNGTGNTIWVNGGWKEKLQEQQHNSFMTAGSNQDQGLYAEVGDANSNKSHLMSTFAGPPTPSGGHYRLGQDPAPYATTTLAMQNRIRTMVSFLKGIDVETMLIIKIQSDTLAAEMFGVGDFWLETRVIIKS